MIAKIFFVLSYLLCVHANPRYTHRIYTQEKAISFADPMKHGFRIILTDEFVKKNLAPTSLPTLFISAIPLRKDEPVITQIIYPDTNLDDKQVVINDLRERSWYIVCIEWESMGRHNETFGTDCKLFRTLDRLGKSADSTLSDIAVPETESQSITFRLRALVEFPTRFTVGLSGGSGPVPPAQMFLLSEASDMEGMFTYLRQYTNYGKLCVLEEPLVSGYTATGRFVQSPSVRKCYFNDLTTKDYDIQTYDSEALARSSSQYSRLLSLFIAALLFFAN